MKGRGGVFQTERDPYVLLLAGAGNERRFGSVLWSNLDLPVSPVSVKCGEYLIIAKQVDAFIHSRKVVRILYGEAVSHLVIDKNWRRPYFFEENKIGDTHSELDGSMTPAFSCLSISNCLSSLVFGRSRYVADLNKRAPRMRSTR